MLWWSSLNSGVMNSFLNSVKRNNTVFTIRKNEQDHALLGSPQSAGYSRYGEGNEVYLNEVQHREGKVLITETAVHHHLHECQQGAGQLSQSKHDLVGDTKESAVSSVPAFPGIFRG